MRQRRMFLVLLCLAAAMGTLTVRLFYLQIFEGIALLGRPASGGLIREAHNQRQLSLVLDPGRGQFTDRYQRPLTGGAYPTLALFPVHGGLAGYDREVEQLIRLLGVSRDEWERFVGAMKEPKLWSEYRHYQDPPLTPNQQKAIAALNLPGVRIAEAVRRYPASYSASHLIGFVSEQPERLQAMYKDRLGSGKLRLSSKIGASGLENAFDALLHAAPQRTLSVYTDAVRNPLAGLGWRTLESHNPFYPVQVVTTLDAELQSKLEKLVGEAGLREGAIVVLDAGNGDIRAMISRPDYDPYDLDMTGDDWSNKALQAFEPGSVFKTVVAAAALEEGVTMPSEVFECTGSYGRFGFTCWKEHGHGRISLKQAYAQSCNIVFAQLAVRLGGDKLEQYAAALGLLQPSGWAEPEHKAAPRRPRQLDAEQAGLVFHPNTDKEDEGVLVQTGIGQRDVRMTPLQGANLVVTLLNGGKTYMPRAVEQIRYRSGEQMEAYPPRKLQRKEGAPQLSRRTSRWLLEAMRMTVTEGTAASLQGTVWNTAGKTGTADVTYRGKPAVNQWMIGFGPVERPRYAVSVAVLHKPGNTRHHQAADIFRKVMEVLAEHEQHKAQG